MDLEEEIATDMATEEMMTIPGRGTTTILVTTILDRSEDTRNVEASQRTRTFSRFVGGYLGLRFVRCSLFGLSTCGFLFLLLPFTSRVRKVSELRHELFITPQPISNYLQSRLIIMVLFASHSGNRKHADDRFVNVLRRQV